MKTNFVKKRRTNTLKKRTVHLNDVNVRYYSMHYKNNTTIPRTQIIHYLFKNFKGFLRYKSICDASNKSTLNLNECFQIESDYFPKGLRKNNIQLNLKMNPKTSLDKLIAYCFYIKQPSIFENNNTLELIKYQIGKDIGRDNRNINDKSYNQEYYHSNAKNSYEIADLFYQNIIDSLYNVNRPVDLNVANKFSLLSCQNVYGLITDLITMQINEMLEPELNTVFRPDKYVNIMITNKQLSMEFHLKTQMLITRNGEPFDPEYPCGNMEFILLIDLMKNVYEIKQFTFSYDIDKCGPESTHINNDVDNNAVEKESNTTFKSQFMIPAATITAGIVSTPFILGVLGGANQIISKQSKRNKNKKNKTIKKQRKKYY